MVAPQRAPLSSDAGLLPIRQLDEQLGLTIAFAAAVPAPPFFPNLRCLFHGVVAVSNELPLCWLWDDRPLAADSWGNIPNGERGARQDEPVSTPVDPT